MQSVATAFTFRPNLRPLVTPYDQYHSPADFDTGYANSITPEVVAKWEAIFRRDSAATLAGVPCRENLAYGPHARNRLDFFPARGGNAPSAPLLIAIHGGLWFLFDKWLAHFLAPAFTAAGFHVAAINYRLAPEHSLGAIVEDCRAATLWLYQRASELNIDRDRVSVLGHSAAGQLCAMVAATRWDELDASVPKQIIERCVGVSGFYDIEPFPLTGFQNMTRFAAEEYVRWNPVNQVSDHLPPGLLITGGEESGLLRQMMERYAMLLRGSRVPVTTVLAEGECHFSVLHGLGNPASALFREAITFLRSEHAVDGGDRVLGGRHARPPT